MNAEEGGHLGWRVGKGETTTLPGVFCLVWSGLAGWDLVFTMCFLACFYKYICASSFEIMRQIDGERLEKGSCSTDYPHACTAMWPTQGCAMGVWELSMSPARPARLLACCVTAVVPSLPVSQCDAGRLALSTASDDRPGDLPAFWGLFWGICGPFSSLVRAVLNNPPAHRIRTPGCILPACCPATAALRSSLLWQPAPPSSSAGQTRARTALDTSQSTVYYHQHVAPALYVLSSAKGGSRPAIPRFNIKLTSTSCATSRALSRLRSVAGNLSHRCPS